ncbi:STL1 [Symbiodinium pilosum]|uniref:STL1 protein n=1 Tax=Symbiodinium pilosum TaxID=2952 RepID=A0A812P8R4_SYMPI|nr:STL1 [Symbiodinium pilosum]
MSSAGGWVVGTVWALRDEKQCDRWIVVTSIFQPSPATRKLGEMTKQGWCYVVVADKNGPKDYDDVEGVIYLTVERQRALHFHIMDHLPWRHFGRKNVGFLYAIAHGAKIIYDTDDDNRLKEARIPILGLDEADGPEINVSRPDVGDVGHGLTSHPGLLNPYPSFRPTCGHIWPRGFPLDFVQSPQTYNRSLVPAQLSRPPAIQQFLADEDPDVDAIFRLTFFTPYNAQCTVHLYEAFWGLLLPVTVHGRVSDIWRAYLAQKLLWDALWRQKMAKGLPGRGLCCLLWGRGECFEWVQSHVLPYLPCRLYIKIAEIVRRSPFWTVLATVLFVQEGRGLLELLARAPRSEGWFTVPRKDTASVCRTWFHDLTGLTFVEGIFIGS